MIYKIGSIDDMQSIVFESEDAKEPVYHYARIQHCLCYSFHDEWFILLYVLIQQLNCNTGFSIRHLFFINNCNTSIVNLHIRLLVAERFC